MTKKRSLGKFMTLDRNFNCTSALDLNGFVFGNPIRTGDPVRPDSPTSNPAYKVAKSSPMHHKFETGPKLPPPFR